jgi:hypothetical protein
VLHVHRARREDEVDARAPPRACEGLDRSVDVLVARARQRRDGRTTHRSGDGTDALEVTGRGDGEAGLDHVDAELVERQGDLDLLGGREDDARRLLAVPECRVENRDPAAICHVQLLLSRTPRGRTCPVLRWTCAPVRRVSRVSP